MSDAKLPEPVTLDWVGIRLLTMGAELHDFQKRFTRMDVRLSALEARFGALEAQFAARLGAMEARFGVLETRYAIQEDRLTAMLDLLVRVAARVGAADGPTAS
jgi:uncharacterized coiled-coil protein SlyX